MKTETQLNELRTKLFAEADRLNELCNEMEAGTKDEVLRIWADINAQLNLLNHITGNTELKTLS